MNVNILKNDCELKDYLKTCNNSRRGQFGEKIFEYFIKETGKKIDSLHKEGADFLVEGIGRVDVKAKVRLNHVLGSRYPRIYRKIPNTSYCYVLFWGDAVEIQLIDDANPSNNFNKVVGWENAYKCWATKIKYKKPAQLYNTEIVKLTRKDLVVWVEDNWGLKAKIIYRQGREAQENMSKGGWGPESFYEKLTTKSLPDLKILLYFDGSEVYEVDAYPISHHEKIKWFESPKGPNKKGIFTFKPKELNPIYKFDSVTQFKEDFLGRFEDALPPKK